MPQRRRWQDGAVYLRRGKRVAMWYGRWWEDRLNADGRLIRSYRKARLGTPQELPTKAKARESLRRLMQIETTAVTLQFSELCERWEKVHIQLLKQSTFEHYRNAIRTLKIVFDGFEVSLITRHDVERFVLDYAARYSHSSIRSLRTTLSIVLGWAVANSWLEKNPVKGVKLPRTYGGRTISRNALSPEQVMELAGSLPEPTATLVVLLYATGLRIGECAGLQWSDLQSGVLHIRRRVYHGMVDDLKTRGSRRKLPISPDIVARLETLRQGEADGFIFQNRDGGPLNPGNWLRRDLRPVAKKLGIKLSGWHDFRVSLSTNLRRQGTHPKLVSSILGHARVQLALDTYDLASTEELTQPLAQISEKLNPNEPKTLNAA